MLRVLAAGDIQKVEPVADQSWEAAVLGPGLIALAAVFAAGLAAWVAVRNTRHQLEHDRRVRSRDHIRDAIDQAAAAFEATRTGSDKLLSCVRGLELLRKAQAAAPYSETGPLQPDQLRKPEEETLQQGRVAREEAYAGLFRMEGSIARLELRLDRGDPIIGSYDHLREAILEMVQRLSPGLADNRIGSPVGDQTRRDLVTRRFDAFRRACYEWFNQ
jgi:hypothetical protein